MGNGQYLPSGYKGDSDWQPIPDWKSVMHVAFNLTMIVVTLCAMACVMVSNVLGAWGYILEQWKK